MRIETMTKDQLADEIVRRGISDLSKSALLARHKDDLLVMLQKDSAKTDPGYGNPRWRKDWG